MPVSASTRYIQSLLWTSHLFFSIFTMYSSQSWVFPLTHPLLLISSFFPSPTPFLMFTPMSRPSGHWHPEGDRRVVYAPNLLPKSDWWVVHAPHPTCFQRVAHGSFMHPPASREWPTGLLIFSTSHSCDLFPSLDPNIASQQLLHPKERPTGLPVHSKSRPCDRRHRTPNVASQRSFSTWSQCRATATSCTQRAPNGPSHPFHIASQRSSPSASKNHVPPTISAQHPPILSHPSDYPYPTIDPWTISSIPFRFPWLSTPTYTPVASQWLPTDEEWTTMLLWIWGGIDKEMKRSRIWLLLIFL